MKAYIIKNIEGDGDAFVKVVDEDTFNYVLHGGTMPLSQQLLLARQYLDHAAPPKPGDFRAGTPAQWLAEAQQAISELSDDFSGVNYADQERAMRATSSDFNGAIFNEGYRDTADVVKFLTDNKLTLVDEFSGHSW